MQPARLSAESWAAATTFALVAATASSAQPLPPHMLASSAGAGVPACSRHQTCSGLAPDSRPLTRQAIQASHAKPQGTGNDDKQKWRAGRIR